MDIDIKIDRTSVECSWGSLKNNPKCPHGPTLSFGKRIDGELKEFYSCSACRDRKLCNFYLEKDKTLSKIQQSYWQEQIKNYVQPYSNHVKFFIKFNELLSDKCDKRGYCYTCELLLNINEKNKHEQHDIKWNLSDEEMNNPTSILKPLSNPKKEAQYMFSNKSTIDIVNMIIECGAKHVLCIGAPKIYEYLNKNYNDKISSLLLDFDPRYHNFFGPLNYCWYNLFNHHFFNEQSIDVFKDYLTQDDGKNIFLVCDPPFGGRLEYLSQTIKTICDLHKSLNKLDDESSLKIFFILPYFMEPAMKIKANPPGINGGLKELKMLDYKVDYDNHPLFINNNGRKFGSPVRIFTNISLNLIKLSEQDGYKYCKRCDKWVSQENKHCKKCKSCTSKDGRRYRHCNTCNRCVKPTWKHCKKCERCLLETHTCGVKPRITGECFKCKSTDHIEKDCPTANKKRKNNNESIESPKNKKIKKNTNDVSDKKKKLQSKKILKQKVLLLRKRKRIFKICRLFFF